jgi:hypothetical protein
MTDSHKFQDGGFIPKEVFPDAREARKNNIYFIVNTSRETLAYITGLPSPNFCTKCFELGIMCCPHKEPTDDQSDSIC